MHKAAADEIEAWIPVGSISIQTCGIFMSYHQSSALHNSSLHSMVKAFGQEASDPPIVEVVYSRCCGGTWNTTLAEENNNLLNNAQALNISGHGRLSNW